MTTEKSKTSPQSAKHFVLRDQVTSDKEQKLLDEDQADLLKPAADLVAAGVNIDQVTSGHRLCLSLWARSS